jgi:nucleotide-binding universal stress UspA family protein
MSSTDRFVIVVGIDFSELANRALDQALEMACLREGSEVHVLYVEPDVWAGATLSAAIQEASNADAAVHQVQQRATERIEKMPAHLERRRIRRVVAHFRRGAPAENVAQLAADLDADLVVVGSHGHRGLERLFLGSVAERVSRLARCPVWIIRPKDHSTAGRVPEIEPPCPDCLTARRESNGEKLWCERHAEHHIRPHRYSYVTRGIFSADTQAYEATPERGA